MPKKFSETTVARAIGSAVLHDSINHAAKDVGVDRKSVRRWLHHPDNVDLVASAQEKKAQSVEKALGMAADMLDLAGERVREVLSRPNQTAGDLKANMTSYGIFVDKADQLSGNRQSPRFSANLQVHARASDLRTGRDLSKLIDSISGPVDMEENQP